MEPAKTVYAMKTKLRVLAAVLVLCAATTLANAQQSVTQDIPRILSYQGLLQTSDGKLVTAEEHITVRLYADPDGKQLIWEDSFTTMVQSGVFNLLLGSKKPLPSSQQMSASLWLSVKIGDADEMRPFTALAASPYALTVADQSITAQKMGTDYLGSVSLNGSRITTRGGDLNLLAGDGMQLSFDASNNALTVGKSIQKPNGGKGGKDILPLDFTNPMTTKGDMIFGSDNGEPARVAGNTSTTKKFLTQTGTGTASAKPAWGVIAASDLPTLGNMNGVTTVPHGGTGDSTLTQNGILIGNGTNNVSTTTLTNGQLLIGSTNAAAQAATLTGTANEVIVTNGAGSITLSTPQAIATLSSPTFNNLTLTGNWAPMLPQH